VISRDLRYRHHHRGIRAVKRLALVALASIAAGCGGSSSTPTAPTPVLACQTNNTATALFQNRSATNLTYDVIWNGARLVSVSPGQDSATYTFAAGVPHTLVFRVTNSSTNACSPSTPTLAQCSSMFYSCTG
jgi:hypothetical protein